VNVATRRQNVERGVGVRLFPNPHDQIVADDDVHVELARESLEPAGHVDGVADHHESSRCSVPMLPTIVSP